MILTHEQLIPLFKGALRVEMSATGYTAPRRFTEKGQEYYNTLGDFGKKARATSCVRLEMMTDSDLFSYEYTLEGASSRKFAYFDLVVDGTVLRHDGYEGISSMSGNITATLPAGTHHVALYFPNLFKGNIRNVTLSGRPLPRWKNPAAFTPWVTPSRRGTTPNFPAAPTPTCLPIC